MKYKGRLYAKIAGKYIQSGHTEDFENLEAKLAIAKESLQKIANWHETFEDEYEDAGAFATYILKLLN